MRIVISVAVFAAGITFLAVGDANAQQWSTGAMGAVVGYWLR